MKFVQHKFISSLSKYFTKEQIIVDIIKDSCQAREIHSRSNKEVVNK